MMRCKDVLALSTAYIDGELDDRRSSAVRGHLRTCPACERAVDDEARVRDSASQLEPLDPPPSLWAGIERRLATAEIADARRSKLWLWWQGVIRPQLPYAGVAGAVAVALVVWLASDRASEQAPDQAQSDLAEQKAEFASESPDELNETHVERAMRQLHATDDKYLAHIAELKSMAEDEREREPWSKEQAARFDQRMAEFERVTLEHRKRLAHDDSGDPATRDMLFALYQAEIEFLQSATLGEL